MKEAGIESEGVRRGPRKNGNVSEEERDRWMVGRDGWRGGEMEGAWRGKEQLE